MKHEDSTDSVEKSRREFLKKAGKLAIYTPPAMMVMMKPSYASFAKSGGSISDRRVRIRATFDDLTPEQQARIRSSWQRILNWLRRMWG